MARTRQYTDRVNIIKMIKLDGKWRFAPVVERDGKITRDHVLVNGKDVQLTLDTQAPTVLFIRVEVECAESTDCFRQESEGRLRQVHRFCSPHHVCTALCDTATA